MSCGPTLTYFGIALNIILHSWSHADLTTLDAAGITSEMTQLEAALLNILGEFPQYMRPPYFSYNDATLQVRDSEEPPLRHIKNISY